MGQQQLLLLVLAAVIVGLAVVTGINMFGANALQANEDAIRNDLVTLSAEAQAFFRRPVALGGGGNNFGNITAWTQLNHPGTTSFTNANATYTFSSSAANALTLVGTSVQNHDNDAAILTLTATVSPNNVTIAVTTAE
jgi:hypothetical protein